MKAPILPRLLRCLLVLLSSYGVSTSAARAGLVTHLALDGNLLDPISGNNGTYVGGVETYVAGHDGTPGGAISFNGTSTYVQLAHTSGLPLRNHPAFSVAFWVQGAAAQADRRVFSEGSSTSNTPLYNIGTNTQGATGPTMAVDVFIRNDANVTQVNHFRSGSAYDGNWHHVTVVDDNGQVAVYVDAVRTGTVSYTRTVSAITNRTSLGAILRAAAGSFFAGAVDDVRLYNHALSLEEILGLVPVPAGCITRLRFDGNLLDSVSGNNGTYFGGLETYVDGFDGTLGGAISFDGASYVRLAHTLGLPLRNNPALSIAMWVKGAPAQVDRRVFSESNSAGNNTPLYNIGTNNLGTDGVVDIFIREDAGTVVNHHKSGRQPFDNTWHHVALVDDNGRLTLYIDGVQEGTAPTYTRGMLSVDTTTLGAILRAAAGSFYTGAIDDVRLYTRAIPADEVRALVPEPAGCPVDGDTTCDALVAAGPMGTTEPGTWTFTAMGVLDTSGDTPQHIFVAENGLGARLYAGPQASNTASFLLTEGNWTVSCTVDDDFFCRDGHAMARCSIPVSVVAVPRELVHLTFDGTLEDATGNGNNGAFTGAPEPPFAQGYDCAPSAALAFDGTDDYVLVQPSDGLPLFNRVTYSISMWARGPMNQVDRRLFSESNNAGNNNTLFNIGTDSAAMPTGVVDIFIRNDAGTAVLNHVKSTTVAFNDAWHHIVWVDNNGNAALYIDGVRDATSFAYTKPVLSVTTTTVGGILRATPCCWFNGRIDDVRVFNYILSETEIGTIFGGGPPICFESGLAGDCNEDGVRDIADLLCYIRVRFPGFYLLSRTIPPLPCPGDLTTPGNVALLDLNGDMAVDVSDITLLSSYLFGGGSPPSQGEACFDVRQDYGCQANLGCEMP